jgi:hypothetical protein
VEVSLGVAPRTLTIIVPLSFQKKVMIEAHASISVPSTAK